MVQLQFGLDTFGDVSTDDDGRPLSAAQTIRNLVEQAVLADELGVDAINVGEHHRNDFAVASPETVLAGIATRTKRITLGTGVTVLSSDDPVRVFQRFATVDALSSGRAEITAGRGSFTESFPLFGFSLADYDVLFDEKLDLLAALLAERPVTWHGTTRAPLVAQDVFPKTERGAIPLRVGVGGTPESVVRAARAGAQLALAVIGGDPARFAPFANLYRRALEDFGRQQDNLQNLLSKREELKEFQRRKREEMQRFARAKADQEQTLDALQQTESAKAAALRKLRENARLLNEIIAALEKRRKQELARSPNKKPRELETGSRYCAPSEGPVVSHYGMQYHALLGTSTRNLGIEIEASSGAPVRAAVSGEVAMIARIPGYGQGLILDNGSGYFTIYANLSEIRVAVGEKVKTCQEIASEAPDPGRVYFEVRKGTETLDPEAWLKRK